MMDRNVDNFIIIIILYYPITINIIMPNHSPLSGPPQYYVNHRCSYTFLHTTQFYLPCLPEEDYC